jgi:hypothetical protein
LTTLVQGAMSDKPSEVLQEDFQSAVKRRKEAKEIRRR